ncbi:MAG: SDR family NAD(P)-dependent oxidoreductase [Candidatus Onthomonas sp.]
MSTLAGRTAVMTGVSGENDLFLVRTLLEQGMNVVMITHQLEQARARIEELGPLGSRCSAVTAVVTDEAETEAAFAQIERQFGSIDLILPKHGGPPKDRPIEEIDGAGFLRELENRVVGSFHMLKAALPYLRKSRAGRVIFVSSAGARMGGAGEGLEYTVSKGALLSLTYKAARLLAPEGITVNCIAVGGMEDPAHDPAREPRAGQIPVGRLGTTADFTAAVCYLASEEAGFVTGQVIHVCGGMYMG